MQVLQDFCILNSQTKSCIYWYQNLTFQKLCMICVVYAQFFGFFVDQFVNLMPNFYFYFKLYFVFIIHLIEIALLQLKITFLKSKNLTFALLPSLLHIFLSLTFFPFVHSTLSQGLRKLLEACCSCDLFQCAHCIRSRSKCAVLC